MPCWGRYEQARPGAPFTGNSRLVMNKKSALPPGQKIYPSFDRFGLGKFASRVPAETAKISIDIAGDVASGMTVAAELARLPRVEQVTDFHCVTTWSFCSLRWEGVRFADFYREIVLPGAAPEGDASFVVLRGKDGYCVSMQLQDLLADDVLLADTLNGEKLGIDHGAPLRLVAPAHYGYKNAKHITAIEFWCDSRHYRFPLPYPNLMDHPRGRVALEERARYIPNWIIRPLYRFLQPFARRKHASYLRAHMKRQQDGHSA